MNTEARLCLKSWYSDDPDTDFAGMGLSFLPLLSPELPQVGMTSWLMSPSEQMGLIYLLEKLRPRVSIEIGTRFGGSLEVISKLSEKVYSLDIDPEVLTRLAGKHANVEYLIGSSFETLPPLIEKLQKGNEAVSFVLIDGDHTAEGVQRDIENVLKLRPTTPLFIVLHDSFNPACRQGMISANWADSPYVHAVELDFVSGTLFPLHKDLWGGLGLAVLLPEKRTGRLEVTGRGNEAFKALEPGHNRRLFQRRVGLSIAYRWRKLTSALGLK